MYSFCDEQVLPDERGHVRLLSVLCVCAIWRGEANTCKDLSSASKERNSDPPPEQWPVGFCFQGTVFEDKERHD